MENFENQLEPENIQEVENSFGYAMVLYIDGIQADETESYTFQDQESVTWTRNDINQRSGDKPWAVIKVKTNLQSAGSDFVAMVGNGQTVEDANKFCSESE